MANKKKRSTNRPKAPAASVASEKLAQDKAEFEASVKEEAAPKPKKEVKDSKESKDSKKGKTVVKAQARAKDLKKASKKPNIFRRFIEYLKQVRLEIKRTTWPTKNEVVNMAIIVLVALLFFGVLIFILDFIMVRLIEQFATLVPTADGAADAANAGLDALTDGTADGAVDGAADATADGGADADADGTEDAGASGAEDATADGTADAPTDGGE